jgi:hypothetical protein
VDEAPRGDHVHDVADEPENDEDDATGAFARVMKMLTPKRGTPRAAVRPRAQEGRPLVLGIEQGARRHFLADRLVENGAVLQLRLIDGTWLGGHYEWSFREGESPRLVISFEGGGQHAIPLPPSAVVRWPPLEEPET